MPRIFRLILTFPTLHKVLAAERALRTAKEAVFKIRPTPTPPGLCTSICGMSIEILDEDQRNQILEFLQSKSIETSGLFEVE